MKIPCIKCKTFYSVKEVGATHIFSMACMFSSESLYTSLLCFLLKKCKIHSPYKQFKQCQTQVIYTVTLFGFLLLFFVFLVFFFRLHMHFTKMMLWCKICCCFVGVFWVFFFPVGIS